MLEAQPPSSHTNMERGVMRGYGRSPWTRTLKKSAWVCAAALLMLILFEPLRGWLWALIESLYFVAVSAIILFWFIKNSRGSRSGSAGSGGIWDPDTGGGDGGGGDGGGGE